jgi:hypothetical protein
VNATAKFILDHLRLRLYQLLPEFTDIPAFHYQRSASPSLAIGPVAIKSQHEKNRIVLWSDRMQ